ncbi:MAG: hypothetical protein ACRDH9_05255 [Actinomycetota bacterium]
MADDRAAKISALLHEAAETHHAVYRITNGADDDWATWYSDWLVNHFELGEMLGSIPVRSHLTAALVELDREYSATSPDQPWEDHYAAGLIDRFGGFG